MPRIVEKESCTDVIWSRVDEIIIHILENDKCLSRDKGRELLDWVKAEWSLAERTASRYISFARKEIKKLTKMNRDEAFKREIHDREWLLKMVKEEDYKLALEVMKDRAKLRGLYIDEIRNESTIKYVDMSKFTEHGLERLKKGDKVEEVMLDPMAIKQ